MSEQKDMQPLEESKLAEVSGGAVLGTDDVFNNIRSILETRLNISTGSVRAGSSIIEDLGADSLDVVDILHSTEDRFQIKVNRTGLENVKTVQDFCDFVRKSM